MNDPYRNTGRTTRMLRAAGELTTIGRRVVVVLRDSGEVARVRQQFVVPPNMVLASAFNLSTIRGQHFYTGFVDHAVPVSKIPDVDHVLSCCCTYAPRYEVHPEEYMRKFDPTKPVRTRSGLPARIICTDAKKDNRPIVALITDRDGEEIDRHYRADGTHLCVSALDLVNIPVRTSTFTNVYAEGNTGNFSAPTREGADEHASRNFGSYKRVGIIEVVKEDGEYVETIYHKIAA